MLYNTTLILIYNTTHNTTYLRQAPFVDDKFPVLVVVLPVLAIILFCCMFILCQRS